jgi:hypothetical protein
MMAMMRADNEKTKTPGGVRILLCLLTVFCLFAFGVPSVSAVPTSGHAVTAPIDLPADQDETGATAIELAGEYIAPASRTATPRVQATRRVAEPVLLFSGRSIAPPSPPPIA